MRGKKSTAEAIAKLKAIIEDFNASKAWRFTPTLLIREKVMYATAIQTTLIKRGYIDSELNYVKPVDFDVFLSQIRERGNLYAHKHYQGIRKPYELERFTAESLVSELRKRGYEVSCKISKVL